ncbi:MAG: GAF domain-containing sensor histidine kinase, partial [Anaerolineales bacterium]
AGPISLLVLTGGNPPSLWLLVMAAAFNIALIFGPWRGMGTALLILVSIHGLWAMGPGVGALEQGFTIQLLLPVLVAAGLASMAAGWIARRRAGDLKQEPEGAERIRRMDVDPKLPAGELPLDRDQVLRVTLDLGLEVLTATGLHIWELSGIAFSFGPRGLREVGRRRFDLSERLLFQGGEGALAEASEKMAVLHLPQVTLDPELGPVAKRFGWGSGLCVPVTNGGETVGLLLFLHARENAFRSEHIDGLRALGQEARLALRFAELYQQQLRERDRLGEIQEEARKKLARDLHDGPTQVIAAIAMRTNFARRQLGRDPESANQELEKVEAMARNTTKEIRHMLFTLRPLILESQGLVAALHQFADKVEETHNQTVMVSADRKVERSLSQASQVALFYIVEEAVTNAQKHAAAENIWVTAEAVDDQVLIEIKDDGVGFNVGQVDAHYEQRGSLGIVTMRERTELLDGSLEIESEQGGGTTIRVQVPQESVGEARREGE